MISGPISLSLLSAFHLSLKVLVRYRFPQQYLALALVHALSSAYTFKHAYSSKKSSDLKKEKDSFNLVAYGAITLYRKNSSFQNFRPESFFFPQRFLFFSLHFNLFELIRVGLSFPFSRPY